ncbi:hypothetical protein FQA39_LY02476 [Lamprigera yunnana]|nr:hypothetical protein FQA39_LY02476 [Lamprigera yunnana]
MFRKSVLLLITFMCFAFVTQGNSKREKRSFFLLPNGGLFKLVLGVAIPVQLGLKQSMAYGLNFQFQYIGAQNYSQLQVYPPIISRNRERRQEKYNDRTLVLGVAIPVQLGLKQSMAYGLNFQFQYIGAQNYSQLQVYPPIISRNRERRQEKYNDRTLVLGVAIPVQLGLKQSMAYGLNFQFQYIGAQNYSQLQVYPPIISRNRERRQEKYNDRTVTYAALESLMEEFKINGKTCLLRSICDNAMESLHTKENGLYGQIIHILLTPNYGNEEAATNLDSSYLDAQKAGEYGVDCISLYPSCPYGHGILDIISTLLEV